ncbi:MAG: NAD(P)/FAD-dependent oxidoreductase [Saprospiraceae bacterium]
MKKQIIIIGAGPAAMSLAAFLDSSKYEVSIYEQSKTAGRKFLVAGKGGFNLTHAEPMATFVEKYKPSEFLREALLSFTNDDLREWLEPLGVPTFGGSSNRVYPMKGIKPIDVLNAILSELENKQVAIYYHHQWLGWTEDGALRINDLEEEEVKILKPDYTVFAMGGASWKVTGSDGSWADLFQERGININPFQGVNCAIGVDWPSHFLEFYEGKPLKNLIIYCNGKKQVGEAVITKFGLEGNALYGLSIEILKSLNQSGEAEIQLDLKPNNSIDALFSKFSNSKEKKRTDKFRKSLKLNNTQLALLKAMTSKTDFLNDEKIVSLIKNLPIKITATAPLDEAISTIGGVSTDVLSSKFELQQIPANFCIGEMVDWYAPTGGYLLQGSFSMGCHLAKHLNEITP